MGENVLAQDICASCDLVQLPLVEHMPAPLVTL